MSVIIAVAAFAGFPASAQTPGADIAGEWHIASFSGNVEKDGAGSSAVSVPVDGSESIPLAGSVTTSGNGQAKLEGPGHDQIRMRENTRLKRVDSSTWEIGSGLTGFQFETNATDTPLHVIRTPWARVECRTGIVIVKVAPGLARVAVLKGTALVMGPGETKRSLSAKQECAAVPTAISRLYDATDDLYYAWYWDKP